MEKNEFLVPLVRQQSALRSFNVCSSLCWIIACEIPQPIHHFVDLRIHHGEARFHR